MQVNIEVQCMLDKNFRGIPTYTTTLLNHLVRRNKNQYSVSFFDYQKERNNKEKLCAHISKEWMPRIIFNECNSDSYKTIIDNSRRDLDKILENNYTDYFDHKADVYHFPHSITIGANLPPRTVVTVHDIIPIIFAGKGFCSPAVEMSFLNSQKYLQQRKDIAIIADSQSTKADLIHYLNMDEERISTIYPSYNEDVCYFEENDDTLKKYVIHSPYILYIGALDPRKGIVDVVKAFGMIQEKNKNLSLVLVGQCDQQFKEVQWIKSLPYADKIIFTGYVTDCEKRHFLSAAEVFLFPSVYEGFGIPVLEAMACGCPVITTNVSSLPEVGGDAALYVPTGRADLIAERVEELLNNGSVRDRCVMLGYQQIKKFSWEQTAQLTEQVYETLV